jgi:hypothetical protein
MKGMFMRRQKRERCLMCGKPRDMAGWCDKCAIENMERAAQAINDRDGKHGRGWIETSILSQMSKQQQQENNHE